MIKNQVSPSLSFLLSPVFFSFFLVGCGYRASQEIHVESLPKELKDCRLFQIEVGTLDTMRAMRCPNSTTSVNYPSGKTRKTVIVVDGIEYEAVKKTGENSIQDEGKR